MLTTTLLLTGLHLAAPAAAPPPAEAPKVKVAVMRFTAPGFKDDAVENLYGLFVAEFDSYPRLQVVSRDEIEAMLGFEAQKSKLGCDDTSCLTEIAGALGVQKIIAGKIGKVGSTFVLNMTMIDHASARVEKRWSRTVKGEDDVLIEAIRQAARELAVLAQGGSQTDALAAGAATEGDATTRTGAATTTTAGATTTADSGGLPILPIALLGVGGVGVLAAAGLGVVSGLQYDAYNKAVDGQDARDLHGQVVGLGVGAGVVAGVGVLVAAAGGALLALSE